MLNPKQKAFLKSLAQKEKAVFQIGKDGLSENLLTDVLNSLPFNTTKVTNISHTPQKRESPKETNLFAFNTSLVVDLSNMFDNCSSLNKLHLSIFNTNQVTNLPYMFFLFIYYKNLIYQNLTLSK